MSKCYKCGLDIAWRRTARGKMQVTNPNGGDHFDDCRQVTNARKMQGEHIKTEREEYYIQPDGKRFYVMRSSGFIGPKI